MNIKINRGDYVAWVLIAAGFALGGWFYQSLPDPMPTHFGLDGQPDDYTPLPWGAFLLPVISIGVYLLMKLLPVISPREFAMDRFTGAYEAVIVCVLAFMAFIQYFLLASAVGNHMDLMPWISVLMGVLFLVIANYITKTQPNFFFGIRTPWTLANEEVWFRTHRQGAYLFALVGIVFILGAPFRLGLVVSVVFAVTVAVWLVIYSYILYVRLDRERSDLSGRS